MGVYQLEDCPITDERVVEVWRDVMRNVALLAPHTTRGAVRLLDDGSASLVLEGDGAWTGAQRLLAAVPRVSAIWWKQADARPRLMVSRADQTTGASFTQVNPQMAARLHAYVIELTRRHSPRSVVDAYAGTGATAIPLAQGGIRVTAIELDRNATEAMASRLPAGSRAIAGAVEEHLPAALPAEVLLVNPPRTGLADAVPPQIVGAAEPPRALIYVSCNPATLGRDLARLEGYRLTSVRGFDMFPQTAHVETVCELIRDAA